MISINILYKTERPSFQGKFFDEEAILGELSEKLREVKNFYPSLANRFLENLKSVVVY